MFDSIARHYDNPINWDYTTLYLYFSILFASLILGFFAQKAKPILYRDRKTSESCRVGISKEYYYFLFILLLIISGFRTIGTDYPAYKEIFTYSTTKYADDFIEPLFLFVNKIIYLSGFQFEGAIFIFSFITIYLVFRTVRQYEHEIAFPLALMAYVALYYLPGFNMMRMYLASSITLYSYRFLLDSKLKQFSILLITAILIHFSSIFFLLPSLGLLIYNRNKRFFWVAFFFCGVAAFKIAAMFSDLSLIDRWAHYGMENEAEKSYGLLHWIINVPLIILFLYAKKKTPHNKYLPTLIVFTVCELLVGLLSYKISILGRSLVYYNVLFIIVVPIVVKALSVRHTRWNKIIIITYILYLFYRFNLYLSEYLYLDGIMPYKTIIS